MIGEGRRPSSDLNTPTEQLKHRVIPAKAGISVCVGTTLEETEIPAFAGLTLWIFGTSVLDRGSQPGKAYRRLV